MPGPKIREPVPARSRRPKKTRPRSSRGAATARRPRAESASAEAVFSRLVEDIVSGRHPPGENLPGERDLSRALGTSRPTLREALRRLGEWKLIDARERTGVRVRAREHWSLEVLPAYVALGAPFEPNPPPTGWIELLRDVLAIRRAMFVEILRVVGQRLRGVSLDPVRQAAREAWDARQDFGRYVRLDFEAVRSIVKTARFLPALWLVNGLGGVYERLAALIGAMAEAVPGLTALMGPPERYVETYDAACARLEAGDVDGACALMHEQLEGQDRQILALLVGEG